MQLAGCSAAVRELNLGIKKFYIAVGHREQVKPFVLDIMLHYNQVPLFVGGTIPTFSFMALAPFSPFLFIHIVQNKVSSGQLY